MRDPSSRRGLVTRSDVIGLIQALKDPDPRRRIGALRALVRLPLPDEVWLDDISPFVLRGISEQSPAAFAWYRPQIILAAGRVATRPVRERLRLLAGEGMTSDGWSAVEALAEARDPVVVPHLLAWMDGGDEERARRAAELLGQLDVSAHRVLVRAHAARAGRLPRFWLSLALARLGEAELLDEELDRADEHPDELRSILPTPFSLGPLAECGPLPGAMVERLEGLLPRLGTGVGQRIVEHLLSVARPMPEPPPPPDPHSPTSLADARRGSGLLRRLHRWQPAGWPGSIVSVPRLAFPFPPDDLAVLTPKQAGRLVNSLFAWAVSAQGEDHHKLVISTEIGNQIVGLVVWLPSGYEPDFRGLFANFRGAGDKPWFGQVRMQLAWAASRAPVRRIVHSMRRWLLVDDGSVRSAAAEFLEYAVRWRTARQLPFYGGRVDTGEVPVEQRGLLDYRDPVVSTGMAADVTPHQPLRRDQPLEPGAAYWFWFEVGEPMPQSIEETPTPLPIDLLPSAARLTVVLFAYSGEIEVGSDQRVGEIQVLPDGFASVIRQPSGESGPPAMPNPNRLFFPIRTPLEVGTYRLRCNVYYEQVLVQSRLVQVPVGVAGRLRSNLDYCLSRSLRPSDLTGIGPHRLSVAAGSEDRATHYFRFYGRHTDGRDLVCTARFDASMLQGMIRDARATMGEVSWSSSGPWKPSHQYRYDDGRCNKDRLNADLIKLAQAGFNIWDRMIDQMECDQAHRVNELRQMMAEPALLQIASREGAQHVVPAAILYDKPHQATSSRVCEHFAQAMAGPDPLWATACFRGRCPNWRDSEVVCPSGFWGYRHALGLPVSRGSQSGAGPADVIGAEPIHLIMAVSTDPNFERREGHLRRLKELLANQSVEVGETRERVLQLLRQPRVDVVYFFCHGGTKGSAAYLRVGSNDEAPIYRSDLRDLEWQSAHPVILINGCQTTALDPEKTMDLVTAFVRNGAVGVVGTEITVFESLACDFAEACLGLFMSGDITIGEAVRRARLRLLKQGNPLGLVYIPFVLANVRLRAADGTSVARAPGHEDNRVRPS